MKTIIISDLDNNRDQKKSIIPYGLNVGKYTNTRVEILHFIDPSLVEGTYSPFSDSQSITPGEKLSHEEVLKRHKDIKNKEIDQLLSKEASRLNFPLRYDVTAEIEETGKGLAATLSDNPQALIVTSTAPSETLIKNLHGLLDMLYEKSNLLLVIPKGTDFVKPARGVIVTNFLTDDFTPFEKIASWTDSFDMQLSAVSIQVEKEDQEQHEKIMQWKERFKSVAGGRYSGKADVILSNDHLKTLESTSEDDDADMLIMSKNRKTTFGDLFFEKDFAAEYIESKGKPVLFY